jgi:hypothetical protein
MDVLEQAEQIVHDLNDTIGLSDLGKELYNHLRDEKAVMHVQLTNDGLKEFINTPLGRLWILTRVKPRVNNREYFLESIKLLRKLLSNVKTLSDANWLSERDKEEPFPS